jgi:CRISPR/Cas system-associated protein Csm6
MHTSFAVPAVLQPSCLFLAMHRRLEEASATSIQSALRGKAAREELERRKAEKARREEEERKRKEEQRWASETTKPA